jgi:hypothetical protein
VSATNSTWEPSVPRIIASSTPSKLVTGRFRPHHAFMVSQHFGHLDYLDEAIAALSIRIEAALRPFAVEQQRLVCGALLKLVGFSRIVYQHHPVVGEARGIFHAYKPGAGPPLDSRVGSPRFSVQCRIVLTPSRTPS